MTREKRDWMPEGFREEWPEKCCSLCKWSSLRAPGRTFCAESGNDSKSWRRVIDRPDVSVCDKWEAWTHD